MWMYETTAASAVAEAAVEGRHLAEVLHDGDGAPIVGHGQPGARRIRYLHADSWCKEIADRI